MFLKISQSILFVISIVLLKCDNGASEIYFRKGAPKVNLGPEAVASGVVKFSRDGRPFSAFTGIQFATVPERFAKAKLITEEEVGWKGVKEFVTEGPVCPQPSFIPGKTFDSDNCLNLNVYVPTRSSKGYPVIVWVHGGGYSFGGGYGYGPLFFMDEDVILVTINYRLGVFGFLSTQDEVIPGNNGLKDQVLALKWVQQNIAKFGGDPGKVTIFGESAGGASVHYLLLSPTAKGLFHRAISQSGSVLCPWAYDPNPKEKAVALATSLNCSDVSTSEKILTCLKNVPKETLKMAQFAVVAQSTWPPGGFTLPFLPTVEPEGIIDPNDEPFLTKTPVDAIKSTEINIPWIVGVTEDEGATMMAGMVLSNEKLVQELDANWSNRVLKLFGYETLIREEDKPQFVEKLRKFYFQDKSVSLETREALVNLGTDAGITGGVYKAVKDTIANGLNKKSIYLYQYAYHGPATVCKGFFNVADEEAKSMIRKFLIAFRFKIYEKNKC